MTRPSNLGWLGGFGFRINELGWVWVGSLMGYIICAINGLGYAQPNYCANPKPTHNRPDYDPAQI